MTVRPLLACLLSTLLPVAAIASTPIDETRPLDARGKVDISNVKGRIQVRVWDKPEVHIGGSLGRGVERLEIEGDRNELEINVRYPHNARNTEATDLIVDVPTFASLDIDGVAVDIEVSGTAARKLEIDTVSGSVTVAGAPGKADIESVSGDLRLTLNSSDVGAETVSGNISLSGRLDGTTDVETVSGNVVVDTKGERVRRLKSSSVSGDIVLKAALADNATLGAESVSGSITFVTPKSLSANVTGESFSGDLSAPGASIHKEKYGPGADFEQRYGAGSAEVHLQTFSGDATLKLE